MDQVLEVLGVEVCPWSYKTDCCGASLGITRPEVGERLAARLLKEAQRAGANCIVTDCPMCQANLDTRQERIVAATGDLQLIPIFYITELVGLALGLEECQQWWERSLRGPTAVVTRAEFAGETAKTTEAKSKKITETKGETGGSGSRSPKLQS